MPDPLLDSTVSSNPLHLHERSVVIPESLFTKMARCYYGDGPNALGRTPAQTPEPQQEQRTGGGTEGRFANPLENVTIQSRPPAGGRLVPKGNAAARNTPPNTAAFPIRFADTVKE